MMCQKTGSLSTSSLLLVCLVALPGCALLQSLLGSTPKPTASITGVRIADFSLNDLTLVFDMAVNNPYQVDLPLVNVDYSLASQSKPFLQGQAPLQGSIPAGKSKTLSLPAKIVFVDLIKALQGVKAGSSVPYKGSLGLSVNAPVLGALRLPLEKEGQLPVPAAPDVSVPSVTWKNVSLAGATGLVKMRVRNPNSFAFDVAGLDYDIKLGDFNLAKGGLTNAASLAAGAAQEIGINVSVSTAQAGMAIVKMLQGQSSGYSLGGTIAIGTPFGPLRIPLAVKGQVPFLR
ncbi:MAG: LEA type 2 family protein [Deltaproteobacteria bacterium]|nr:LEA type 2 family protein [Deltaproteobacteria bacterium]